MIRIVLIFTFFSSVLVAQKLEPIFSELNRRTLLINNEIGIKRKPLSPDVIKVFQNGDLKSKKKIKLPFSCYSNFVNLENGSMVYVSYKTNEGIKNPMYASEIDLDIIQIDKNFELEYNTKIATFKSDFGGIVIGHEGLTNEKVSFYSEIKHSANNKYLMVYTNKVYQVNEREITGEYYQRIKPSDADNLPERNHICLLDNNLNVLFSGEYSFDETKYEIIDRIQFINNDGEVFIAFKINTDKENDGFYWRILKIDLKGNLVEMKVPVKNGYFRQSKLKFFNEKIMIGSIVSGYGFNIIEIDMKSFEFNKNEEYHISDEQSEKLKEIKIPGNIGAISSFDFNSRGELYYAIRYQQAVFVDKGYEYRLGSLGVIKVNTDRKIDVTVFPMKSQVGVIASLDIVNTKRGFVLLTSTNPNPLDEFISNFEKKKKEKRYHTCLSMIHLSNANPELKRVEIDHFFTKKSETLFGYMSAFNSEDLGLVIGPVRKLVFPNGIYVLSF